MESEQLQEKSRRGFAAMPPEKQRAIASRGGKLAHEKGVAHKWSREEAMEAGKKGGAATAKKGFVNRGENDGCDHLL